MDRLTSNIFIPLQCIFGQYFCYRLKQVTKSFWKVFSIILRANFVSRKMFWLDRDRCQQKRFEEKCQVVVSKKTHLAKIGSDWMEKKLGCQVNDRALVVTAFKRYKRSIFATWFISAFDLWFTLNEGSKRILFEHASK